MIIETHKVGPVKCNCSIVGCDRTKEAVVVDPGGDENLILERVTALGVDVKYALITHAHFDHVLAAAALHDATNCVVCVHGKDRRLYRLMPVQYKLFGGVKGRRPPRPGRWLKDKDAIRFGDLQAQVIHTPGHTPGSCCYHFANQKLLFSGDTLFRESVGNYAVPGGSLTKLVDSVQNKLLTLPDETRVMPGHLEETTIGHERQHNYLSAEKIQWAREYLAKRSRAAKMFLAISNLLVGC